MSHRIGVAWKIKLKKGPMEIEVVEMKPQVTKAWFDEIEKK